MLPTKSPNIFSVAPMLDWTDKHCRYFHRLLTKHALLYTEMVTTGAILHGDHQRHLAFSPQEHPVALQLGGSEPTALAACAKIAEDYGYDEINLNVGCPSNRVQSGRFGACLMAEPELVAECIAAMRAKVKVPVTVKSRIGIDDQEDYTELHRFISIVAAAGCDTFIIHARKAWLQGLSPKQNREIPPLRYDIAAKIVADFPALTIILNGGISSLKDAQAHLGVFSGVMLGRAVYHEPYLLAEVDQHFYQATNKPLTRHEVLYLYIKYVAEQLQESVPLNRLAKPLFGLFQGLPGARSWRRYLSEHVHSPSADENILRKAEDFLLK